MKRFMNGAFTPRRVSDPERLLVVSHVVHYAHAGRLFAYGPYAREIDIWADLFPTVVIAAPCRHETPPGDAIAFTRPNITVQPLRETGGPTAGAKLTQLLAVPGLIVGLIRAMRQADAIHVRCPGNLGLLGTILAPVFSRRLVAKYAGQWNGYASEPWSIRLQRAILRSPWWRGPVTVYGDWPDQPGHVVPFFTSMMSIEQVSHAADVAATRTVGSPLRVLFLGRLSRQKRVDALVDAVRRVGEGGDRVELTVVGDGPEMDTLRDRATRLGLEQVVRFVGSIPFEDALTWCEWADCLVLPSESEGWPKAIAEGMCYGLVCIGMDRGQVPAMLTGRGIVLKEGTSEEIASALQAVIHQPEPFHAMARAGSEWARQYSLEGLREALAKLLTTRWRLADTFGSGRWSVEVDPATAGGARMALSGGDQHGVS